jgi:hypothetical protein
VKRERRFAYLKQRIELGAQLLAKGGADDVTRHVPLFHQNFANWAARTRRQALTNASLPARIEKAVLHQDFAEHGHPRIGLNGDNLAACEKDPVLAARAIRRRFSQSNEPGHPRAQQRAQHVAQRRFREFSRYLHATGLTAASKLGQLRRRRIPRKAFYALEEILSG